MATVYLAEHIGTHMQYAIKVLDPKYYKDQNILQRFKREASIGKALTHKSIPTFHGFEYDKGLYYIIMEYVQGYNIRQYLKKFGLFPVKDAIFILNELLQTLQYAYDNGIQAHRDIKPENIMIDPKTKTIKVMDFGVSRMEDSTLTTETKIYTVKYASPEQLIPTRFPKGVTQQSDLYSLGIVFYEMLTGKLPFEGTTQVDIVEQELNFSVTPPNEVNTAIPGYISNMVLKALLPNPHNRYQNTEEMRQDLISRNCQTPLPKNKSYGIQKRSTMVYWLGGFLGVVLVAGSIFAWGYMKDKDYVNVTLNSNPQGSYVYVDGMQLQETLTPAKISLSKEMHNITIVKDEFEKAGSNLNLTNETKKNIIVSFDLQPIKERETNIDGLLFVKSDPEEAKIYVDGIFIGDTPLENFGILAGEHSLYISKNGYYNSKPGTFYINENLPGKELYKTSLHLLLAKIPPQQKKSSSSKTPPKNILASFPATVEINTIPPGALVKINNEFIDTTPLIVQLPPNSYTINIEKMGYEVYSEEISLDGNSNRTINVSLVSKIGKPILRNPENNSTNIKLPVEFTWEKSENASHYRVYITNLKTGYKV
ncbi:MAG: serine/threonine protein kinase, partial [Caldisericia bacterium]|nr:serine/threonine protein kinase [Caldisericia bacterium]